MTRKLVGYSTVGTNNKEKAEEFYNAIFSPIDAFFEHFDFYIYL